MQRKPDNGSDEKAFHQLSDHELLDIMIQRGKRFLRAHGVHVLFGLAVILLVVVIVQTVLARRRLANLQGHEQLSSQQSVAMLTSVYSRPIPQVEQSRLEMMTQCRQIIEEHSASSAVPWARIRLGQLHALHQDWEKAAAQYETVLAEYENETIANAARAALAAVQEDLGEYTTAAALYETVAKRMPMYLMHAGRCYEMADDLEAAAAVYARVEVADVPDGMKEGADARRKAIKRGGRYVYSPPPRVDIEVATPPLRDVGPREPTVETPVEDMGAPAETPAAETRPDALPEDDSAE